VQPKPDAGHNGCDMKMPGCINHTDEIAIVAALMLRENRDDV
jgi:hypothetical protein